MMKLPRSAKLPPCDCTHEKPRLHERVRLYFANQRRAAGRWSGMGWFSEGREVQPIAWQYFDFAGLWTGSAPAPKALR